MMLDDEDDELLFGDDAAAVKRMERKKKKTSRAKDGLSFMDAIMAEEKERQKQIDSIRAQTVASHKRREEVVGQADEFFSIHEAPTKKRMSLSPLQIDWDYIYQSKTKKTHDESSTKNNDGKKKRKSERLRTFLDENDDCSRQTDGLWDQCDEVHAYELPQKVMVSRKAAEAVIAKWLTRGTRGTTLGKALTDLAKRNEADELVEAFVALSLSSDWQSHRPWVLAVAGLDARLPVARAALAALTKSSMPTSDSDTLHVLNDILDTSLPESTTSPKNCEDAVTAVERLAQVLALAPANEALAARLISDLCLDRSFATSLSCRAAARDYFNKCEAATIARLPIEFSSPAHTLIAMRLLPLSSEGVTIFLRRVLACELKQTAFKQLLKAESQHDSLGYIASSLAAMARDSGGGNAAVPVLGNHAALHVALVAIHRLYSCIATQLSHEDHTLLLKNAFDLKQRFRQEIDPMAVRNNDILECFLAGLRRSSAQPTKKQGRLTFTSSATAATSNAKAPTAPNTTAALTPALAAAVTAT